MKFIKLIQNALNWIKDAYRRDATSHPCRILRIEKHDENEHIAVIQLVKKNVVFKMSPEEILADDKLTDSFSQRDIRTLTYLGYLGINAPKYKILAQRLSAENKLIFALHEKGKKEPLIKTADEISSDEKILSGLDQKNAHLIGYTTANEKAHIEERQRSSLLENSKKSAKPSNS